MFAMLNHRGQWSEEYKIFGRLNKIGFRPSPLLNDENDLNENAREIYDNLVDSAGDSSSEDSFEMVQRIPYGE